MAERCNRNEVPRGTEPCRCENSHCQVCHGGPCSNEAGQTKVLYIGMMCDGCAKYIDPKYIIPADYEACGECGFDHDYETNEAVSWHSSNVLPGSS